MEEYIAPDGKATGIYIIDEEDSVNDVSEEGLNDNSEDISEESLIEGMTLEERLNSKTMAENMDAGLKIMGIGMATVFLVLTILYVIVKIMGQFVKGKKDNEKN